MTRRLAPPLKSRNGTTLRVLAVCRISGPNQAPKNLADQEALLRRYVADHYESPTDWEVLKTQGSGEILDHSEIETHLRQDDSRMGRSHQ